MTKLKKEEIDEVILVGGSTKIPKVKQIVKNYFPKCKINDNINPDEVVAYGATLEAEKILYNNDESITNFNLLDIVPFSLGTDIVNINNNSKEKEMSIIIKKGTLKPCYNSRTYYTVNDNQ